MKKLLFAAALLLAVASYGGKITAVAHADTMTPEQNAALQQTLEVLKAKLVNLEMQAGQVPQGDAAGASVTATASPSPVSVPSQTGAGISATESASISSALGTLVTALSNLNATLMAHPEMVAANQVQIAAVLGGMTNTLASINSEIATGGASNIASNVPAPSQSGSQSAGNPVAVSAQPTPAPIAASTPSTPAASTPAATTPTTPTITQVAGNTSQAPTAQTANIFSSSWNFVKSHWPTFTIILLVIAILLILFWPQKEEDTRPAVRESAKPTPNVVTVNVSTPTSAPVTVSTAAATPAQKIDVQAMKAKKPAF